jgi:hypothetical protein
MNIKRKFRLGWQRYHELPELQDPKVLRIPPAEQFFRDMYFGLGSWSAKELADLVDYLGYDPDPISYDNLVWLREQLVEILDVLDMGHNHWHLTEDSIWAFLQA